MSTTSLRLAFIAVLALLACAALLPSPGPVPQAAASGPARTLAGFDFAGGRRFPERPVIALGDVTVPPGARAAHVPVTLDRPPATTVVARVRTLNGQGQDKAYSGAHYDMLDRHVIFRPGDPLRQTVRVKLNALADGRTFAIAFPSGVLGAKVGKGRAAIRARAGAAPSRPERTRPGPPRAFAPDGAPDYTLEPATARWSPKGSAKSWATQLPHGRTQPGNNESGLYLDPDLHDSPRPSIARRDGALVLASQSLPRGIEHGGTTWRHGAVVLSGHKFQATHLTYGQIEWTARMPNRRGAWPALWLLPEHGWPPEIDVYEGFGYSRDWDFARDISANIHGGSGGKRSFTRLMRLDGRAVYDIGAEKGGLDEAYHRFAVDIGPDTITWFIDGTEVYRALNPFPGTKWFPLMTVAVKHKGDYEGGSGAMHIRSMKLWRD
jgi:hypothetical protein